MPSLAEIFELEKKGIARASPEGAEGKRLSPFNQMVIAVKEDHPHVVQASKPQCSGEEGEGAGWGGGPPINPHDLTN